MLEKEEKRFSWNEADELVGRCTQELGDYLGVTRDVYAMRAIHYLLRRVYDHAFNWGYLVGKKEGVEQLLEAQKERSERHENANT